MTLAKGKSEILETVFDNRFSHVGEYRRFGANIQLSDKCAIVYGVDKLSGAPCEGSDIRAASGLVLMALAAKGSTSIGNVFHIERGYERFSENCALSELQ